jgi:hypothetical protein
MSYKVLQKWPFLFFQTLEQTTDNSQSLLENLKKEFTRIEMMHKTMITSGLWHFFLVFLEQIV